MVKRTVRPRGASRWQWAAWWLDLIVTYAGYLAMAYVAVHFMRKYW